LASIANLKHCYPKGKGREGEGDGEGDGEGEICDIGRS